MALAAAISHLQLALGNLEHVLRSCRIGEEDQRLLHHMSEALVELCKLGDPQRHMGLHSERLGNLQPSMQPMIRTMSQTSSNGVPNGKLKVHEAFAPADSEAEGMPVPNYSGKVVSDTRSDGAASDCSDDRLVERQRQVSAASEEASSIAASDAFDQQDVQDTAGLGESTHEVSAGVRRALNAQRNVLLNLFHKLDADKSGVIEAEELKNALRAVGQHPQRAEKLIAAADENCNGKVEIHEWIHVVDRLVAGKGGAVMENFTKALVQADYGNQALHSSYTWNWDDKPWNWLLRGTGSPRMVWDTLLFLLLIYIAVVMPYTLAYLQENDFQRGMNAFMTSCFCLDVLLNFRTTFLDEAGEEVHNSCRIAKRYLKTWFFLDFVTAVPWELLTDGITDETMGGLKLLRTSKVFKILRVVRAVKLWKILKASELGSMLEDAVMHSNSGRRAFELLRILVACCLLCHLLACFMHISGSGFLETYEWTGESAASKYICSLYWAMTTVTTVGYGDIIPRSDEERIFTMAAMIIGGAFYGYVVGNISVILASNDVNWRAHKERLEIIDAWISHHRFPAQLRRRIWAFFKMAVSHQVVWDDGVVFAELSSELREEVASYLIHPELQRNLIFRGVPTSIMIRIVSILQQVTVRKGEQVVPDGRFQFGMFIVLDGTAILEKDIDAPEGNEFSIFSRDILTAQAGKRLTEVLRRTDSFGEEVLLGLKSQYEYTVTPSRRTVMLLLPRDQFMERCSGMPEVFTIMRTNFTS